MLLTAVVVGLVGWQWFNYRNAAAYWGNNMYGNGYWLAPYNEHVAELEKVDSFSYSKAIGFEPNVDTNNKALSYALQMFSDGNTVVNVNVPVLAVKSAITKFVNGNFLLFTPLTKVALTGALFNSNSFMLDLASKNVEAVDQFDFIKSLAIAVK